MVLLMRNIIGEPPVGLEYVEYIGLMFIVITLIIGLCKFFLDLGAWIRRGL